MSEKMLRKCIIKMNDCAIGEYFVCQDCKHFMLTRKTAELHLKCTRRLLAPFQPDEDIYRCSTCGRYYDNKEQWARHNDMHKLIGDYNPNNFVYRIDESNFVKGS